MSLDHLRRRIDRLQDDAGGFCDCGAPVIHTPWYGETVEAPKPGACDACGRELPVIKLVEDEGWYGNNAHDEARRREAETS